MQTSVTKATGNLVGGVLVALCADARGAPAENGGYDFEGIYTADVLSNVSGGLATGTRYLDNLDLMLEVDVERAWGFATGTLFVYGLYNNGTTFADELVGDLQVVSNIDAPGAWRLYELWYDVDLGPVSFRTGMYDLNSEFDVNKTGSLFLNSSHGIGPAISQTGENGPGIFPVSALAFRTAFEAEHVTLRFAVLDGVPGDPEDAESNRIHLSGDEGALVIGEGDLSVAGGRLWAGLWRYTASFERPFASGSSNDNDGWYIGAEREFTLGSRSAAGFLRYGRANEQLNPIGDYLGAGVVVRGVLPGRPDDELGLSFASARAGEPYRRHLEQVAGGAERHETEWELTYRARINDHVVVQPDVQLVRNPAASPQIDDAWIVGLRLELAY